MLTGILLGLGASACWAIANVAVQRSTRRVGTARALLWSQLLGLGLVAAAAPLVDGPIQRPTGGDLAWLVGGGAAALLAYLCMFHAFEHGRLTIAVPIVSGWAVLASAISLLVFHQRLRPAQLAGAAAVIAGALVVSRYVRAGAPASGARAPSSSRWLVASLGAAVGFGLVIPTLGRLGPVLGSLGAVGGVYAVGIVIGLPLAAAARTSLAAPPAAALPPIAVAGLFEAAGFACIAFGQRQAPLAVVAPLASLASALTVVYAWAVLKERPPTPVAVGAALACVGVVALSL